MKKGISESKVQRMRNLASGNYTANTKAVSGYNKVTKDYKEGDVWEQGGKQWTIKRGIKRTVSKLDTARKLQRVPLACPKCSESLSHPANKKMYKRWGMCLSCVTTWEVKMKSEDRYKQFVEEFDEKNFNAFIKNITEEYEDWLKARDSKHYISEAGDIEDWSGGKSKKELANDFKQTINEIKQKRADNKDES
tara:strand:- start:197 stop:775 length:579 start_codon:yes stop_codon:yes gene_type:complete